MKPTIHPLAQGSILVAGTLALSLIFRTLNPCFALLIVYVIMQMTVETVWHIKQIAKHKATYAKGEALNVVVNYEYKRMIIDIITNILWFLLACALVYLANKFI